MDKCANEDEPGDHGSCRPRFWNRGEGERAVVIQREEPQVLSWNGGIAATGNILIEVRARDAITSRAAGVECGRGQVLVRALSSCWAVGHDAIEAGLFCTKRVLVR